MGRRVDSPLTYAGHDGQVKCVAWSPDGGRVASSGHDGVLLVADAETGTAEARCRFGHPVTTVAWTRDARRVLMGWMGAHDRRVGRRNRHARDLPRDHR